MHCIIEIWLSKVSRAIHEILSFSNFFIIFFQNLPYEILDINGGIISFGDG